MIRIYDMYVSLSNIKQIYYNKIGDCQYMYIVYQYEETPVKIEVGSFDDYIAYAEEIKEALK